MATCAPTWSAVAPSIDSLDTMIAAHALSQQALLVASDTGEFAKVPGLQLDNWVAAT